MKFKSKLERFATVLWDQHIIVPQEAVTQFKTTRIICKLNGQVEYHCALTSKGDGSWFIRVNKEHRDQLNLELGDELTAEIRKDESKYGFPLPDEMEALLDQDPEFDKWFHQLTPGKQRSLLYVVGKPKRSQIRINKAIVIANHLKSRKGKLDFRILNEDFKSFNKR